MFASAELPMPTRRYNMVSLRPIHLAQGAHTCLYIPPGPSPSPS